MSYMVFLLVFMRFIRYTIQIGMALSFGASQHEEHGAHHGGQGALPHAGLAGGHDEGYEEVQEHGRPRIDLKTDLKIDINRP